LEWGGNGKGFKRGRSVYEEPETKVDRSCHSKEGFQVSKGDKERAKGESARGNKKQGDCAIYIVNCICVYNAVSNVDNNLNCV
jgi:hypothetical protein